jgi:phosphopantothenate-cysteine ligase
MVDQPPPRTILVTGGGTVAPVDQVRRIANTSSGRFSACLSEAFLRLGHQVTHLHTPDASRPFHRLAQFSLDAPDPRAEADRLLQLHDEWQTHRPRLQLVPLHQGTVAEYAKTLQALLAPGKVDIALLAMAVSDYLPVPAPGKLDSSAEELLIRCTRAPKVIAQVRDWAPDVFLVGFKLLAGATPHELAQAARKSLAANRADLVVANVLDRLTPTSHPVTLVGPDVDESLDGSPESVAQALAQRILANHVAR